MLSEQEEKRLTQFFVTDKELIADLDYNPKFYIETVKWLASKLKETNDECSKVHEELQKTNEELARMHELYD